MSRRHAEAPLYPAYCFEASPTYDIWVKITGSDLHSLTRRPGFEVQNIFFYLNHPIRYVQLVGVVVAIDDVPPRLAFFTIDDGSGETVEVKITRLPPEIAESADCPSNTEVDNVNVITGIGRYGLLVDDEELKVASVVKVKGTLSVYKENKQIELKRVSIVRSSTEECAFWSSLAAFKSDVLSQPWSLPASERKALEERARAKERQKGEQEQEYREKWRVYNAKMRLREEKQGRQLRKEEVMMNAGALPGTDRVTYPAYMNG